MSGPAPTWWPLTQFHLKLCGRRRPRSEGLRVWEGLGGHQGLSRGTGNGPTPRHSPAQVTKGGPNTFGTQSYARKVNLLGRKVILPRRKMTPSCCPEAWITTTLWLLVTSSLPDTVTGQPPVPPGKPGGPFCLEQFTVGVPDFVLDTDASVSNGATFLGSPVVRRGWDCVRACCTTPFCNLALVEQQPDGGEDAINACFLLNCLYEHTFVCKFSRKEGFINYLTQDLYKSYRELRKQGFGGARLRIGMELKVQPQEPLVLRDTESTEWHLVRGDTNVKVEKKEPDEVELSQLKEGMYVFQLTLKEPDQKQDTANLTIIVLSPKQTEEHCLAPKKVGRCRGSFPRWYYDPTEQLCKSFVYGGCLGNKNNYLREEECKMACRDVQGPSIQRHQPVCPGHCQPFQFRCHDGCCIDGFMECDDLPDCLDASDEAACDKYTAGFDELQNTHFPSNKEHCVDLPDTGLCTESIPRWYYNPFSERCDLFTYGGCEGNKNNFLDQETCLKSCEGISKKDVFGLRRESPNPHTGSVEVAVAVLLGTCIVIVVAILGYCFFKNHLNRSLRRHHPLHHHHPPPTPGSSTISTTEDTEHLVYNHTTRPL
ncbi:kunitz-type protease inhibitor 1 [Trichosurus vulpecula]|uniref:kunitz-type protease inhibitor 1 n=1 Tax=Trichosurus vulpecula TaxID=9337 RepID=UPI00186B3B64|nr:kunitz-type protease inhibitor 1 [Trichosurus vulpecula]